MLFFFKYCADMNKKKELVRWNWWSGRAQPNYWQYHLQLVPFLPHETLYRWYIFTVAYNPALLSFKLLIQLRLIVDHNFAQNTLNFVRWPKKPQHDFRIIKNPWKKKQIYTKKKLTLTPICNGVKSLILGVSIGSCIDRGQDIMVAT